MDERLKLAMENFPTSREEIRRRLLVDPEFRALCEDFGSAGQALRRWQVFSGSNREARISEYTQLQRELETEILNALGADLPTKQHR